MTEQMIVEAVRSAAAGAPQAAGAAAQATQPDAVASPEAVAKFEAAMGVEGANAVEAPDPVPFASQATAAWRSAQVNNQGILHRIRALSQLGRMHGASAGELVELQYEVMNLSFQQEVVTKVADKTSNAIQTLIKNQ